MSPPRPTPAEIAAAGPFPPVDGTLDRALALVEYLREHCAWDARQTARSLIPHLLEETHETVDAIRREDPEGLRDELGDLLLNLAFQVVVGEQEGAFTREGVVRTLEEKMIRRHPHLFGLGEPTTWESIKARERAEGDTDRTRPEGILAGLPEGLSSLLRAHRIQERVAGVGFDWEEPRGALGKIREELAEVEAALDGADPGALEEEIGDLLFSVVNLARMTGLHATPALDRANRKFERRFETLEALAAAEGIDVTRASLAELDGLWEQVKRQEPLSTPRPDPPG